MQPVMDQGIYAHAIFNQLEARWNGSNAEFRWEGQGWLGTDYDKLWIKSEGTVSQGAVDDGQDQFLYNRAITTYLDLQGGLRSDIDRSRYPNPCRRRDIISRRERGDAARVAQPIRQLRTFCEWAWQSRCCDSQRTEDAAKSLTLFLLTALQLCWRADSQQLKCEPWSARSLTSAIPIWGKLFCLMAIAVSLQQPYKAHCAAVITRGNASQLDDI